MSVKEAIRFLPYLKQLSQARTKQRRIKILSNCPKKVYKIISEIVKHVVKGTIKLPPTKQRKLRLYKNDLRKLTKKISPKQKERLINQRGGFLPGLLIQIVPFFANIEANKLIK